MTADHDTDPGPDPPGRSPQRRIRIPGTVWAPALRRAWHDAPDDPSHLSTLITEWLRRYAEGENP